MAVIEFDVRSMTVGPHDAVDDAPIAMAPCRIETVIMSVCVNTCNSDVCRINTFAG